MFFIISKVLAFLLTPLTWVLGIFLLALLTKREKRRKRLLLIGILCIWFFGNGFIADEFMRLHEPSPKLMGELKGPYDAGIVLGGGMISNDTRNGIATFRHNTDRILQAVDLYKKGIIRKIMISGGAGQLTYRNMLEAPLLRDYLITIGIPKQDILLDSLSDNTHENAVNTAKILNDSLPGGSFLLITSASHMARAAGCFRKAGLKIDTYPVDFNSGPRRWTFYHMVVPQTDAFVLWNEMIHEWTGYLIYAITGYI